MARFAVFVAAAVLGATAASGMPSSPVPSGDMAASRVRAALGDEALASRLRGMGLSPAEARARVDRLDPAAVDRLSAAVDGIQDGGFWVIFLIVALVVFVILLEFFALLFLGGLDEEPGTYPGPHGRPHR